MELELLASVEEIVDGSQKQMKEGQKSSNYHEFIIILGFFVKNAPAPANHQEKARKCKLGRQKESLTYDLKENELRTCPRC